MPEVQEVMRARGVRTVALKKNQWLANAHANRARVTREIGELWLDENPKHGVLIAAGPSLAASLPELLALDRATHEIVCVDMALSFLVRNGLIPDYVICADASPEIAATLDVPLLEARVPLLLQVTADPETGKNWQGPVYWFVAMSNVKDGDAGQWMQAQHEKASGVSSFLVPGGNVGSLGLSFLAGVRACPRILLYGHDFCWKSPDVFYCGGDRQDLARKRLESEAAAGTTYATRDITGGAVSTNASLVNFASWYADIDRVFPGLLLQRTPTTILRTGGLPS